MTRPFQHRGTPAGICGRCGGQVGLWGWEGEMPSGHQSTLVNSTEHINLLSDRPQFSSTHLQFSASTRCKGCSLENGPVLAYLIDGLKALPRSAWERAGYDMYEDGPSSDWWTAIVDATKYGEGPFDLATYDGQGQTGRLIGHRTGDSAWSVWCPVRADPLSESNRPAYADLVDQVAAIPK